MQRRIVRIVLNLLYSDLELIDQLRGRIDNVEHSRENILLHIFCGPNTELCVVPSAAAATAGGSRRRR